MGKVAGKPGSLDFIGNLEGKAYAPFTPSGGVAGVVSVQQEGWGKRLQECCEVHRSSCFANPAFETCDRNNHGRSFMYFWTDTHTDGYTYKNTGRNASILRM